MDDKLAAARGCRSFKNGRCDANEMNGYDGVGITVMSAPQTLLIFKLPDSRALRIVSRSLFLAMVLLALPSIGSIIGAWESPDVGVGGDNGLEILPILHDLKDEGLITHGHKGFVVGETRLGDIEEDLESFLKEVGVHLLTGADLNLNVGGCSDGGGQAFDFVFAPRLLGAHQLINGILKDGGLVISLLGVDLSDELRLPKNINIVYVRRFGSTVVATRKVKAGALSDGVAADVLRKQVLCGGFTCERRKDALKGLEAVYLEPPRRMKGTIFTSRKIKFLPDLLKDSLDEYPRRIFISDESRAVDWFYKNYPMRGQEFEVYHMSGDALVQGVMMKINVRLEDFVVVKAEARVVEEMLNVKGGLCVVDELFLECKNQWDEGKDDNDGNGSRSTRAYWLCLSLYGRVRDEGIAVHQWWY